MAAGSSAGWSRRLTIAARIRRRVWLAPHVDPGLGALGEDHLDQRLPKEVGPRGVEVGPHQFLLADLPAPPPGDQIATGYGDLEELGGRRPRRGLLPTHRRTPLEVGQVRRHDAGGSCGPAEGRLAVRDAGLVRGQDLAGCPRPADGGVPRQLQQIQRPGQRRDDPQLVVEVDEPFHGQVVPAEVLDALLGDEGQALVPGDPLQRGPCVIGGRRVLFGQFRQSRRDLRILVLIHRDYRRRGSWRREAGARCQLVRS